MKLSITKSAAIIAALAMATTGALVLNQNKADAATVATTNSGSYAHLYTDQGKLITNRALAPNTPWLVGKTATINGETMYQVATNEYLKASDSSLSGDNANQQQNTNPGTVLTIVGPSQFLYNDTTNSLSNRALGSGSKWQVGKVITNSKGDRYYQVSTHEWVKKSYNSILNHDTGDGQYTADFMINADSSSNTNDNDNNSGNTEVTTPSTNENNNSTSSKQNDTQAIKTEFMNSINTERASKGLSQLTNDPQIQKLADIRIDEVLQTHSHYRPNGTKWYTLLPELGIKYTTGGENIAMEFTGMSPNSMAEDTMQSFREETYAQNHYDNVMNPSITKMGVAVKYDSLYDAYQIVEEFIG